jgi:vancomycin resistance protein YoaR
MSTRSSSSPRPRGIALRLGASLAVLAAASGSLALACRAVLPAPGAVARGVLAGGAPCDEGDPVRVAESRARDLLDRRIALTVDDAVVAEVSLGELGATVNTERLSRRLASVGREGDVFDRVVESLSARGGSVDVPVSVTLPIEPLAARLERIKDETDTPPRGARFDFANGKPTAHVAGRYLDLYAAASALERAAMTGEGRVAVPGFEIAPLASSEVVARLDTSKVVKSYSTRFGHLGKQAGRAQNVSRAAAGVDGVVLMPGEITSFNAEVGPRSTDNGFAPAPEIYKGEMREGIGGGTCQVASTLHAAAYLGGLEIVERVNHSRPSGYIPMGLDATVVYPHVDLKVKNTYSFPVIVRAVADKGTLTVELRGSGSADSVDWTTATVGVSPYKRKIEETPWVAEGKIVVKQKGIKGYAIRKTRKVKSADGRARVEEKTDVYPPTFEIFQVSPGTDPESLPPLPGMEAEATAQSNG